MCDSKARPPLIRGEQGGMTNDVLFSNAVGFAPLTPPRYDGFER